MKYVYILQANINYLQEANYIFDHYNRNIFSSKLQKRLCFVDPANDKYLSRTQACGYYLPKKGIILNKDVIISKQVLRETLIHEMCHQAVREIDGNKDASHGGAWRNYMKKCGVNNPKETIRSIDYLHEKPITRLNMDSFLLGKPALLKYNSGSGKDLLQGRVLLYIPLPDDNGEYICYYKSVKGKQVLCLTRKSKNEFPLFCVSRRAELSIKSAITNSYVSDFIKEKIDGGFIFDHYSTKSIEELDRIYANLTNII